MYFTYGTDRKDWYWSKQVDNGVPNTGQRVSLPNPQSPDTLPISVDQGKADKVSAIYFGLLDRGLQPGSQIVQFKLSMQEGDTPSTNPTSNKDQPEFNAQGHQIEACRATEFWPDGGGAEQWPAKTTTTPIAFDQSACVIGKPSGAAGSVFWNFDLTKIVQQWGANPNANFGFVLYPVIPKSPGPQDQSWQINLKIPARDDPTTPNDEYKDTLKRVVGTIAFTSPTTTTPGPPTTPPPGGGGGGSTSTGGSGGTFTGGGSFTGGAPTTTTTTTTTTGSGGSGSGGSGTTNLNTVGTIPPVRLPGIVWALIPIGLLAIWGIRQVVLEPVGGQREDGVISAIRRRNAAARGMPLTEDEDMLAQARAAGRRARSLIRRSLRRR
jgi:hypothetical protein